ncbi:DUF3035 domain-containing protein [Sphingomicrobium sp. XHP0239]|uniref:DUF3035 domain-containing protein n=1 Tax=Sphingomicrobium maritimum TaxID=3133972 RepID=UPI0031CCC11D
MRNALPILLLAGALAACSSPGGSLDEYAVARNAPLIIPPDYTLEPPRAGTVSTSVDEVQARALEALYGGPASRSAVERIAVSEAADGVIPLGARSTAGDPDTRVVDKGAQTQTILSTPEGEGQEASAEQPR